MSRERPAASPLHGLYRLGGELIALVYIAIIAAIACATGAVYVLFPELGALSHDVMTRPRGTWANAPLLLAVTPVLTGVVGIVFTRSLPYGYLSFCLPSPARSRSFSPCARRSRPRSLRGCFRWCWG